MHVHLSPRLCTVSWMLKHLPTPSRGLAGLQCGTNCADHPVGFTKVLAGDEDDLPAGGVQPVEPVAVRPHLQRRAVPHAVVFDSEPVSRDSGRDGALGSASSSAWRACTMPRSCRSHSRSPALYAQPGPPAVRRRVGDRVWQLSVKQQVEGGAPARSDTDPRPGLRLIGPHLATPQVDSCPAEQPSLQAGHHFDRIVGHRERHTAQRRRRSASDHRVGRHSDDPATQRAYCRTTIHSGSKLSTAHVAPRAGPQGA
jgi:hypothetical protein